MSDFLLLLARKIDEVKQDPAQSRQVIYDAARMALRRQANLQRPYLSNAEVCQRMAELEEAIALIEAAEAARADRNAGPDTPAEAASDLSSTMSSDIAAGIPFGVPQDGPDLAGPPAPASETVASGDLEAEPDYVPRDLDADPASPGLPDADSDPAMAALPDERAASRQELVVAPPRRYVPAYRQPDVIYDMGFPEYPPVVRPYEPPRREPPPSAGRRLLSSAALLLQLTIASAAGVTIYAVLAGRGILPAPVTPAAREAPAKTRPAEPAVASAPPRAAFPLPTMFGVYAIRDNRLVELQPAATAPADPRTRNLLQITKPPRITFPDGRVSFVVFRRDLIVSAPERFPVRIAAKISRMMTFDPNGKAVHAAPPAETWFIRDVGYDMRVLPVRESQEMVLLRPDDPDFSLPAGRYELMINNQPYDFAVAGAVTDPGHCVEGSQTMRGPVFYECRRD